MRTVDIFYDQNVHTSFIRNTDISACRLVESLLNFKIKLAGLHDHTCRRHPMRHSLLPSSIFPMEHLRGFLNWAVSSSPLVLNSSFSWSQRPILCFLWSFCSSLTKVENTWLWFPRSVMHTRWPGIAESYQSSCENKRTPHSTNIHLKFFPFLLRNNYSQKCIKHNCKAQCTQCDWYPDQQRGHYPHSLALFPSIKVPPKGNHSFEFYHR